MPPNVDQYIEDMYFNVEDRDSPPNDDVDDINEGQNDGEFRSPIGMYK